MALKMAVGATFASTVVIFQTSRMEEESYIFLIRFRSAGEAKQRSLTANFYVEFAIVQCTD